MPFWIFWPALYLSCTLAGLIVAPGAPEAMGFAFPAFAAAALAAWMARRRTVRARHLLATSIAAALVLGALTGLLADGGAVDMRHAYQVSQPEAA